MSTFAFVAHVYDAAVVRINRSKSVLAGSNAREHTDVLENMS